MSSSIGIVESWDKGFVLDLKLLFSIVNCFLGRFPPRFFTVKLVCFIDFPRSSYLVQHGFNHLLNNLVLSFYYTILLRSNRSREFLRYT